DFSWNWNTMGRWVNFVYLVCLVYRNQQPTTNNQQPRTNNSDQQLLSNQEFVERYTILIFQESIKRGSSERSEALRGKCEALPPQLA
ncbi:hypothetical protein DRI96_01765, partial [Candidatus Aerophobetes bacterium]